MSTAEVHFKAPMGNSVKILTGIAYALLLILGTVAAWSLRDPATSRPAAYLALGVVSCLALGALAFRIRGYVVSGQRLVIQYGFGRRAVALSEIQGVEPVREVFRGAFRLFASGGLWSFLGLFRSSRLGSFSAYVSDPARAVLISTKPRPIVVSPADPAGFVRELKQRIPQLA